MEQAKTARAAFCRVQARFSRQVHAPIKDYSGREGNPRIDFSIFPMLSIVPILTFLAAQIDARSHAN
jgi:hypothetical protein